MPYLCINPIYLELEGRMSLCPGDGVFFQFLPCFLNAEIV
jgi:hypothetical protein